MRFLFRLIPILLGIITVLAFIGINIWFTNFIWILGCFFVLFIYGLFRLLGRRVREKDYWGAKLLMILFALSAFVFYLLIEDVASRILVVLISGVIITFLAEQLYRWYYTTERIPSYALGVSVSLLQIFTVFFLSADFIGLRIFIRAPLWSLLVGFTLLIMLLVLTGRTAQGLKSKNIGETLLMGLLFGELFGAVLFLPSSFQVGGALLALAWYIIVGLLKVLESGLPARRTAARYAIVGVILFFIIVITARWF